MVIDVWGVGTFEKVRITCSFILQVESRQTMHPVTCYAVRGTQTHTEVIGESPGKRCGADFFVKEQQLESGGAIEGDRIAECRECLQKK